MTTHSQAEAQRDWTERLRPPLRRTCNGGEIKAACREEANVTTRAAAGCLALVLCACQASSATDQPAITATAAATDTQAPATVSPAASPAPSVDLSSLFDVTDWIAYLGPVDGDDGVRLVHPDGSDDQGLTPPAGAVVVLADWSPDGQRLVMASRGGPPELLYVYDLASETFTTPIPCEDDCLGDDDPAYSPDGTRVAFQRYLGPFTPNGPSNCNLWIGTLATGEVEQVTFGEGCQQPASPRWSPDGTRIAYFRESRESGGLSDAVFVLDLATGTETQLTDWELAAGYPSWSPDGDWIVMATHPFWTFNFDEVPSDLYRMHPDGTGLEQLTFYDSPSTRANQPRYTPDGNWIVFTADTGTNRELWAMPAEGGEPVTLISNGIYTHAAWQPTP